MLVNIISICVLVEIINILYTDVICVNKSGKCIFSYILTVSTYVKVRRWNLPFIFRPSRLPPCLLPNTYINRTLI